MHRVVVIFSVGIGGSCGCGISGRCEHGNGCGSGGGGDGVDNGEGGKGSYGQKILQKDKWWLWEWISCLLWLWIII